MQGLYAQGSELARAAGGVMNSHAMIPLVSTARVTIIGENIIEVRDDNAYIPHHSLIAVISNDPWMNNLHRRSFPVFAKAVELAVKSFLYNKLIIDFDEAFLRQGQSMDTVKAAVEQYADAETMFQEHMTTTMPKVLFMNDERQWHRWIRSQISISS